MSITYNDAILDHVIFLELHHIMIYFDISWYIISYYIISDLFYHIVLYYIPIFEVNNTIQQSNFVVLQKLIDHLPSLA